jgi:hemerythrin superfamily protein
MPEAHTPRGQIEDDALDLLATDHDEITDLFERYEQLAAEEADADERREVAEELCTLLLAHAEVKEQIFYPAVREVLDDESAVDDAVVALDSARSMIDEVQAGDPTEPRYDKSLGVLHELVAQHFRDEREQLFPRLRSAPIDLEELGAEIAARQEVLLSADDD